MKLQNLKIILLIMIISSCKGNHGFEYPEYQLSKYTDTSLLPANYKTEDPEILPFYDSFISYANFYNYPLPGTKIYLALDDLEASDSHIKGKCIETSEGNAVVIDRSYWNTLSDTSKEILVFHELGHCLLNRTHRTLYFQGTNKTYDQGMIPSWEYSTHPNWPMSLMHRSLIGENKYNQERDYYLSELFMKFNLI